MDKGTGRVRLPHRAFVSEPGTPATHFKLGELALVSLTASPHDVYLCTAWPSETVESASLDPLVRFPVPQGASILSIPRSTTHVAVIYKFKDWNLFHPGTEAVKAPKMPLVAREISIRFFGDATKNSHTHTKKLQVKALLESKFIANGSIIAKDKSGGMEIVSCFPMASLSSDSLDLIGLPFIVTDTTCVQFVSLAETLANQISLDTRLDSIGGMKDAKKSLIELLCLPLKYKSQLEAIGTTVPRGILLHGPPGVGKTLLVKESARQIGVPVLSISATEVYNPVLGQSELILRQLFEKAESMMGSPSSSSQGPSTPLNLYESYFGKQTNATPSNEGDIQPENAFSQSRLDRYSAGGHHAGGVIIFIDEIDAICGKRDSHGSSNSNQLETRIIAQLLTLLEETRAVVIAATNRPNALDPALRRPGRFDREIEIPLPSASDRSEILFNLLSKVKLDEQSFYASGILSEPDLRTAVSEYFSRSTQSWSGADLTALVRESCLISMRRHVNQTVGADRKLEGVLEFEDMESALLKIKPTSQRGWTMEVPKTTWNDIGGLEEVKEKMKMLVEWPVIHGKAFERLGLEIPKGVLLHGPPGCAKTTLVRAVANACQASFVCLSGADVYSPLLGEAERKIRDIFKKARSARPSIIFFDEIDAMVCKRGSESDAVSTRVLTQLLTEMDGIEDLNDSDSSSGHILVMAATNRPDQLDPALLRPGRFDRIVEIPMPDEHTRHAIFKVHTKDLPLAPLNLLHTGLIQLSKMTHGCSGADIQAICREAAILTLKRDIRCQTIPITDLIHAACYHTRQEIPTSSNLGDELVHPTIVNEM